MSLNINEERLLAEALADAMERDLADVPAKEQLEKQHRFSRKFVRRMKRIEKGIETGNEAKVEFGRKVGDETEPDLERKIVEEVETERRTGHKKRKPLSLDFVKLVRNAKRYGGMAAALVCIIGMAAFLGVMGRMGAPKGNDAGFPSEDMWEEVQEESGEAGESASSELNGAGDMPEDDAMEVPADDSKDAPENAPSNLEESVNTTKEPVAPGWQEQLLAESKKADKMIRWHLTAVYDGMSFVLESELVDTGEMEHSPPPLVNASLIYEVYYQEKDEWIRVYRTNRSMSRCEPRTVWGDEYFMQDLNMTRPGTYRVVRQVNTNRQVLELALERME